MCGWQGGWRHFGGAIFGIGWQGSDVAPTEAEVRPEGGPGLRAASECRKAKPSSGKRRRRARRPRACGHIAIYHSPAYVFIIAMLLTTVIPAKAGVHRSA